MAKTRRDSDANYPRTTILDDALKLSTFGAPNDPDDFTGDYENFIHDPMHGVVGGDGGHMTDGKISPQDPIFWLFHCNIDRLWRIWQHKPLWFLSLSSFIRPKRQYPTFGLLPGRRKDDFMVPWATQPPSSYRKLNVRVKDVLNAKNFDPSVHPFLGKGYTFDNEFTPYIKAP